MDVYASDKTKRIAADATIRLRTVLFHRHAPAKKLLLPEPFLPTTTLWFAENGSI